MILSKYSNELMLYNNVAWRLSDFMLYAGLKIYMLPSQNIGEAQTWPSVTLDGNIVYMTGLDLCSHMDIFFILFKQSVIPSFPV